jgi:hypothetical protein
MMYKIVFLIFGWFDKLLPPFHIHWVGNPLIPTILYAEVYRS